MNRKEQILAVKPENISQEMRAKAHDYAKSKMPPKWDLNDATHSEMEKFYDHYYLCLMQTYADEERKAAYNQALEDAVNSIGYEDCHVIEGYCGIYSIKKTILNLKKQ